SIALFWRACMASAPSPARIATAAAARPTQAGRPATLSAPATAPATIARMIGRARLNRENKLVIGHPLSFEFFLQGVVGAVHAGLAVGLQRFDLPQLVVERLDHLIDGRFFRHATARVIADDLAVWAKGWRHMRQYPVVVAI